MSKTISVTIRGVSYQSDRYSQMAIIPLLPLYDGQPENVPELNTDAYEAWKNTDEGRDWNSKVLERFSDPVNQGKLAYCITTIFPKIPESLVSYDLYQSGNQYKVDFTMLLSLQEVMNFVETLAPQMEVEPEEVRSPGEIEAEIKKLQSQLPKAQGFAETQSA